VTVRGGAAVDRQGQGGLAPTLLASAALLGWGLAPAGDASGTPSAVREALRNDMPSRADYEKIERGYYEQILDANRGPSPAATAPGGAVMEHSQITTFVGDLREWVLRPGLDNDPAWRIPWSTNSHGMRDREYPVEKPPATLRVALAGDSIGSGWGVSDGEGFEARLEAELDARSRAEGGPAVEFLNFSVPGHGPGQRWTHFAREGWVFSPDLVVFEATPADAGWDERRLRGLLARGLGFDAPVYRATLADAGVRPGLDEEAYKRALRPLRWALLDGVYRTAAADCKARGVAAVWVLIPRVGKPADPADRRRLVALARAAGFDTVVDACDSYEGADPRDLAVGANDFHPNAEGHARIARALGPAIEARLRAALAQDHEGAETR
jgi:lysophospholipase L1-like esterase